MINARHAVFLLVLSIFPLPITGQSAAHSTTGSAASAGPSKRFLPVSEVREGMRGKARTVFRGSEPEEFDVEILGVVPGAIGPKQDLIVGRIGGGNADRTAVFAGMSGSPVYVDGRLVGAISYSFPFSKEAICGITPIEQMINIFEQAQPAQKAARQPGAVSFSELASGKNAPSISVLQNSSGGLVSVAGSSSMLAAVAGQTFRPIGTPVTFTGISPSTLDRFCLLYTSPS
ncbi:MAG: SpoIVB peptidase S55 domain-containing protein, partial [Pyrinomonadaceae bacterium]|nr:SpoIVB peptidase S55 domain-containing protein [Pyrinomonadaceae bacterium]